MRQRRVDGAAGGAAEGDGAVALSPCPSSSARATAADGPPPPRDDRALLEACREGRPGAWRAMVARYERLVFSVARSHGLEHADAADVTQHAFLELFQRAHGLADDSHLGSWLATVARRKSWRVRRRAARAVGSDLPLESLGEDDRAAGATSLPRMEDVERLLWLDDGLSALDPRCRRLVLSLWFDPNEPSYEQVARRLGVAAGSVGSLRARCLERLRDLLGPPPGARSPGTEPDGDARHAGSAQGAGSSGGSSGQSS